MVPYLGKLRKIGIIFLEKINDGVLIMGENAIWIFKNEAKAELLLL